MRIAVIVLLLCLNAWLRAQTFELNSPDKKLKITVRVDKQIRFDLSFLGQKRFSGASIAMELPNGMVLGRNPVLTASKKKHIDREIKPVVPQKNRLIRDACNQLELTFQKPFKLVFRAYDNGFAYRFVTFFPKELTVLREKAEFLFTNDDSVYFPEEKGFITHFERSYKRLPLSAIGPNQMSSVPVLIAFPDGAKLAVMESDLRDYPGMYVTGSHARKLSLLFPRAVLEVKPGRKPDRDEVVVRRAEYIARTKGSRTFPWRIFALSETDADLITNELVFQLASPLKLEETGWIKPGKVAWDWWNALNIYGVDFRAGLNTATYKYYIDFAAKYGLEYIILDEGWSKTTDLLQVNPDIDLGELFAYAKKKKVGIILWVLWKPLERQLDRALDQFAQWGAAGIKVDFMQRDDQAMVNYYWKIAKAAAERHLLVNFHGAYKPAGLRRAYPNVITREGVKGLEHNKWSSDITPEHDVTIPFIRMLAGPMDYTPGAMVNAQKKNFRVIYDRPMSQGTRCHQLAMYVIYESPLQMLADNPSNYLRENLSMEFLSQVPTVWDETRVLKAKTGDYLIVARHSEDTWFLGGMTDWSPRTFNVPMEFLGAGTYTAQIWQDGVNADRFASDLRYETREINKDIVLKIKMAPGGGWVAVLKPKN